MMLVTVKVAVRVAPAYVAEMTALVVAPTSEPAPRSYPPGGYLKGGRVPLDPWGEAYQYEAPGQHNPHAFDLWSLGADFKMWWMWLTGRLGPELRRAGVTPE